MKLVEPGPQPPPFKVEYSELESDKPRSEPPPQEESSPVESPGEATADAPPAVTPDDSLAVDAKSQSATDPAASKSQSADNSSGDGESFGAGLDVGDVAAEPAGNEQSVVEKESQGASAGSAATADSGSGAEKKKRGKRPNRRRRSRRGQKKDGGTPKSES